MCTNHGIIKYAFATMYFILKNTVLIYCKYKAGYLFEHKIIFDKKLFNGTVLVFCFPKLESVLYRGYMVYLEYRVDYNIG